MSHTLILKSIEGLWAFSSDIITCDYYKSLQLTKVVGNLMSEGIHWRISLWADSLVGSEVLFEGLMSSLKGWTLRTWF